MAFFNGIGAKAAVIALVASAPAFALVRPPVIETAGDDEGFSSTGLTSFAPIEGRGYTLKASLSTLYDGNILRIGDGFQPRPGAQRSDFRLTPLVTGNIGLPIGRQQFFAGASIGYDGYVANTDLNRTRFIAGGGFNFHAGSRCTATVASNYSSRQILVSQLSEQIPNNRTELSYGLSASCQLPSGLGAGVTLRRIETGNSAPGREAFNINSSLVSPYISYGRPTLGTFSLTANLNYVSYPNRTILDTNGMVQQDGANIFSGRFGYQRAIGSRLTLGAGISYLSSQPQPQVILAEDAELGILFPLNRPNFSGGGYDFTVTYTPSPRLGTTLAFSREATASPNVGALYQVVSAYGIDVNYQLGAAINVGLGGTYTIRDYSGSFVSPGELLPRLQDNISRVYGRLTYSPPRIYSVSMTLAYQNRNSDPVEYSFDSFSALLTISLKFGRDS